MRKASQPPARWESLYIFGEHRLIIILLVFISRNSQLADTFIIDPREGIRHMQNAQDVIKRWEPSADPLSELM
jgi:hypothetical protein